MTSEPIDLLIWGSCVSRDSLEFFPPDTVNLRRYVARQSLISANKPVRNPETLDLDFPSRFQKSMYRDDLAGTAIDRIAAKAKQCRNPFLVMGLLDERGGVLEAPDGGIITSEPDALSHGVLEATGPEWQRHLFPSLNYVVKLAEALPVIQSQLKDAGIWDRTYLLPARWAEVDDAGAATQTSLFESVAVANEYFQDLYGMFAEAGWKFVPLNDAPPVAKVDHKWGLAPFHYTDTYYQEMAAEILALSASPTSRD